MRKKRISRSVIALALIGAIALTGCDNDNDNGDNGGDIGNTTTTTILDMTTTTLAP